MSYYSGDGGGGWGVVAVKDGRCLLVGFEVAAVVKMVVMEADVAVPVVTVVMDAVVIEAVVLAGAITHYSGIGYSKALSK